MRKVATDVLTGVVRRTPVDTGRARASWGVGINRVDVVANYTATDRTGQKTILAGLLSINQWKPEDEILIVSRLPYINRLEFDGWSRQAPAGMVRVTIAEFSAYVDAAVRQLPE